MWSGVKGCLRFLTKTFFGDGLVDKECCWIRIIRQEAILVFWLCDGLKFGKLITISGLYLEFCNCSFVLVSPNLVFIVFCCLNI